MNVSRHTTRALRPQITVPVGRAINTSFTTTLSSNQLSEREQPSSTDKTHQVATTAPVASAEAQKKSEPKKKTQKELDDELMSKMAGIAGDGGESGVEYEDGKPVAMKRSVRDNMFRYI